MTGQVRTVWPELPKLAERDTRRGVFVADVSGRCEVFAWDRTRDTARQVTSREHGTAHCAIDPSGSVIWWFDDGPDGSGVWRSQDFHGGPDRTAVPGGLVGRPAGLAASAEGTTAIGVEVADHLEIYLERGGSATRIHRRSGYGYLADVTPDGRILAVGGEPQHPDAVTLVDSTGALVHTLDGSSTGSLWPVGFAPGADEAALLLIVERDGGYGLALVGPDRAMTVLPWCTFDTEVAASWCPDGTTVLVHQARHTRSVLHLADLRRAQLTQVDLPPGSILDATVQPDGDLQYLWTDSCTPVTFQSAAGLRLPGVPDQPPASVGRTDELWSPGAGGDIHSLVTTPVDAVGPFPTVFLVHGGPHSHDRDAYNPLVVLFASAGFAVARVNYRGSTGYGPAWYGAVDAGVGITQLQDLASVREDLVRRGTAAVDRTAICGYSWGGYIALLGLGLQPDLWQVGAAVNPIADYVAAFRHSTRAVRALDMQLFGGTPDDVPLRYQRSSPVTYIDRVRAPVLIMASRYDMKCPPRQIEAYVDRLRGRGVPHEFGWIDAGHDGYDGNNGAVALDAVWSFVRRHLGAPATGRPRGRVPQAAHGGAKAASTGKGPSESQ